MSLPFYFYFDINYLNIFRRGCENIFWKSNSCELLVRLDTGDLGDGRLYCLSTVSFESHFSVILRLRLWSDHLNKNILDKLRIHITPPSYVLHHTHTHTHTHTRALPMIQTPSYFVSSTHHEGCQYTKLMQFYVLETQMTLLTPHLHRVT